MTYRGIVVMFALSVFLTATNLTAGAIASNNAHSHGILAREIIKVVNQDGMPVANARIFGASQTGDTYHDYIAFSGITDTNGVYAIEVKCTYGIRCQIVKEGFYDSEFLLQDYAYTHTVDAGKWMPFGSETTIVLKKVNNPVATGTLYVTQDIPTYGEWLGYDLEVADWLPPWGKGKVSDAMIRFSAREVGMFDFGYKMELSFENSPFAGAIRQQKDLFSVYSCAYAATTNDVYESTMSFEVDRTGAKRRIWNKLENNEYLVFRTRTTVDKRGQLVSAHYGRIDGEWKFHELHGMWIKGVFFNKEANDLNLEDKFSYEEQKRREQQREESRSAK